MNSRRNPKTNKKAKASSIAKNPTQMTVDRYFDYTSSGTVSTTSVRASCLGGLLSATGLLATFPQQTTAVGQGSSSYLYQRVKLTYMELSVRYLGAQGNALVAGDLYNTIRFATYVQGGQFSVTPGTGPYLVGTDVGPNQQLVEKLLEDRVVPLCSHAFDASNYNVPDNKFFYRRIPINQILDCYSTTALGTAAWLTQEYDVIANHVSDSALPTHPEIFINMRIHCQFLRS